jgi:succinoglycan biosynthesis protein ExoM
LPDQPEFAPMLSIVVPTFRREPYLPPLFTAVADQISTVTDPVELVLVDNSPEASARDIPAPDFVRYIHEPRTGVAQARNRGVAEARGTHVIFLDDDERPAPGWLAAFAASARRGDRAAFGAVEPLFEAEPPPALHAPLDRIFSRRLPSPSGAEVQSLRAYLGSGNSMFARATLTLVDPPFDTSFNAGGEDVWLFRQLVDQHQVPMIWCPGALVHELVPPRRATMEFLRARRFSDGQLRCLVESDAGGLKAAGRVALWMAVGAAQLGIFGLLALVTRPFSEARSVRFQLAAVGGAGKLLWWRRKVSP